MFESQVLQGRFLTQTHLDELNALIAAYPHASRNHLSILLAERWNWRSATGQLKDMAARTLMLKLQGRGWIALPPRRRAPSHRRPQGTDPELFDAITPEPIKQSLKTLTPLNLLV